MKKTISLILSGLLVASSAMPAAGAVLTKPKFRDTNGHWAAAAIDTWSELGVISGYDGLFRPNDFITRGEFAVILDRILDFQKTAENKFTDLGQNFYTDAILKAARQGVIAGFSDGTVKPDAKISRQDAMAMITRALLVRASEGYEIKAKDAEDIAKYAVESVAALESKGVVTGREGGKIYPAAEITRAEVITVFDKLISKLYTQGGTYSEAVAGSGNLVATTDGVALKGITVAGDLVIAPGVGEGDFTLTDVKVEGNVIVLGGGVNTIKFAGSTSVAGQVIVRKVGAPARLQADSGVKLPLVVIEAGGDAVQLNGSFDAVLVKSDAVLTLPQGTKLQQLTLDAKAQVAGKGEIIKAILTEAASGAKLETKPSVISAAKGITVDVAGKSYTATDKGLTENTEAPSGGGGGGGSETSIAATGVTLYLNDDEAVSGVSSSEGYSFDLTGRAASDYVSGIEILTSKDTTYTVGKYAIATNKKVGIDEFLGMLGMGTSTKITMGKIRALGDKMSVPGLLTGGNKVKVSFVVGNQAPYAYTVEEAGNITTATAALASGKSSITLEDFAASLSADPVAFLMRSVQEENAAYTLKVITKDGVENEKAFSYQQVKGMTIQSLLEKMDGRYGFHTLGDLTGLQVQVTYSAGGTAKTLALVFA